VKGSLKGVNEESPEEAIADAIKAFEASHEELTTSLR